MLFFFFFWITPMTSLWHHQGLSSPSVPQGNFQAPSRLSTCPLRRPACTAAPPPTSWERRTATSTCPSTAVRGCLFTHNPSLPLFSTATWVILMFSRFSAAPESSSGMLQGVLLTLSMCLVLLALLVLVLWLHRTGQDGRWRQGKEEECYNEIRYTPSLMKRSFVWFLKKKEMPQTPSDKLKTPETLLLSCSLWIFTARPVLPANHCIAAQHHKNWNKCKVSNRCGILFTRCIYNCTAWHTLLFLQCYDL